MLIYAFVRCRDWIRLTAVFYAGMIFMSTGLYLGVGLLGDAPLFHMACGPDSGFDYKFVSPTQSLALNLPYPLVAFLLVARMWATATVHAASPLGGRRLIVQAEGVVAPTCPEGFQRWCGSDWPMYVSKLSRVYPDSQARDQNGDNREQDRVCRVKARRVGCAHA